MHYFRGFKLKKVELTQFLNDINLTKKNFAHICNISYNTVNNWNDENRPVPPWVKSWLENYIEKQKHEKLKQSLRESGVCDDK